MQVDGTITNSNRNRRDRFPSHELKGKEKRIGGSGRDRGARRSHEHPSDQVLVVIAIFTRRG